MMLATLTGSDDGYDEDVLAAIQEQLGGLDPGAMNHWEPEDR